MKSRIAICVLLFLAFSVVASHSGSISFVEQEAAGYRGAKPNPDDIPAARVVADPFPAFNGIAVDPDHGLVVTSDPNRKSLLVYRPAAAKRENGVTVPEAHIIGPATNIGMAAGVLFDPAHREIFTANNDIEDTVVVMPYTANGNASPVRMLSVPHQAWGLTLGTKHDQIAITVQLHNAVAFFRRDAHGVDKPVAFLHGPDTQLADPHGVAWDELHNEVVVANHGNFRGLMKNTGAGCEPAAAADTSAEEAGVFLPPSVTIYAGEERGNVKPARVLQGERTRLDWPMGVAVDPAHDEIAVANNGDSSVLIFSRSQQGNAAPVRVIRGARTQINHPMGVAFDPRTNELWVSNFGDHSAVSFDRAASGNVAPKRILRAAPEGAPVPGFGNPEGVAYDSKRQQILVPN